MTQQKITSETSFRRAVREYDARALLGFASKAAASISLESCRLLATLGLVGRLSVSRFVSTARIESGNGILNIKLGHDFLRDYVVGKDDLDSSASLLWIIQHELAHCLLGHLNVEWHVTSTRRQGHVDLYARACHQMAADICVTRFLNDTWSGPIPAVDQRSHSEGVLDALVATPQTILGAQWKSGCSIPATRILTEFLRRAATTCPGVPHQATAALANFYVTSWERPRICVEDIERTLVTLLQPWRKQLEDHECVEILLLSNDPPFLPSDMVQAIPARWRRLIQKAYAPRRRAGVFGGHGDVMEDSETTGRVDPVLVRHIMSLLTQKLMRFQRQLKLGEKFSDDFRSPVGLTISRKEVFAIAAGYPPVLYPALQPENPSPIVAFVDTSGSTFEFWLSCFAALKAVVRGSRPVRSLQFSNQVAELSITSGNMLARTTGGTDFDCVVRWSLKHLSKDCCPAFVLTDGYASLQRDLMLAAAGRGLSFQILLMNEYDEGKNDVCKSLQEMFGPCLAPDGIVILSRGAEDECGVDGVVFGSDNKSSTATWEKEAEEAAVEEAKRAGYE